MRGPDKVRFFHVPWMQHRCLLRNGRGLRAASTSGKTTWVENIHMAPQYVSIPSLRSCLGQRGGKVHGRNAVFWRLLERTWPYSFLWEAVVQVSHGVSRHRPPRFTDGSASVVSSSPRLQSDSILCLLYFSLQRSCFTVTRCPSGDVQLHRAVDTSTVRARKEAEPALSQLHVLTTVGVPSLCGFTCHSIRWQVSNSKRDTWATSCTFVSFVKGGCNGTHQPGEDHCTAEKPCKHQKLVHPSTRWPRWVYMLTFKNLLKQ